MRVILDQYDNSFPFKTIKPRGKKCNWINSLLNMIIHKKYFLRKLKRHNRSEDHIKFKAYNAMLKNGIALAKKSYFSSFGNCGDMKTKWLHLNNLLNKKAKHLHTPTIPPFNFAKHFLDILSHKQTLSKPISQFKTFEKTIFLKNTDNHVMFFTAQE